MQPTPRRGAKVNDRVARAQKVMTLLQFKQFVCSTRTKTFLLGPLIKAVVRRVNHFYEPAVYSDKFNSKKKPSLELQAGLDSGKQSRRSTRSLHLKFDAAIDCPRPLRVLIDERFVFTEARGRHAAGIDSPGG